MGRRARRPNREGGTDGKCTALGVPRGQRQPGARMGGFFLRGSDSRSDSNARGSVAPRLSDEPLFLLGHRMPLSRGSQGKDWRGVREVHLRSQEDRPCTCSQSWGVRSSAIVPRLPERDLNTCKLADPNRGRASGSPPEYGRSSRTQAEPLGHGQAQPARLRHELRVGDGIAELVRIAAQAESGDLRWAGARQEAAHSGQGVVKT